MTPIQIVVAYCGGGMTAEQAEATLRHHGPNAPSVVAEMAKTIGATVTSMEPVSTGYPDIE